MSPNKVIYWQTIMLIAEQIWQRDCKWNRRLEAWKKAAEQI